MPIQQTNPDLSLGNVRPGVFVAVNLNAPGGGIGQVERRLLIAGYKLASGTYPQDTPIQPLSQNEVNAGGGVTSDIARGYGAAIAEVGAGNIDVFVLPLVEPVGGTASTYKAIFIGTATAPGSIDLSIDGRSILSVGFSTGDTAAIIAAAVLVAVQAMTDAPVVAGISTATLTFTYVHKGDVGEDLPIRCKVNGTATGISVSCGSVVFTGTAGATGSAQLVIGGTTITAVITNAFTLAQSATALAAAINAGAFPVTASITTPGTVDLFYAPDRDVRRFTVSLVSVTVQTVSGTTGGTVGLGQPTLTAALTNLSTQPGWAGWAVPFIGTQAIPDLATLSAIATHVELRANGVGQQEQRVHACATWPSAVAGTIPVGTTPALTSSPRYAMMWCQDLGIQGFELACRMAAARVNNDYPPRNWDGYAFKSSATAPLVLPAGASQPTGDIINIAMRGYFLCPVRVDGGTNQLVVEKATTTSNSAYLPLRDFGCIDQIAFWRRDLARELSDQFKAVSAKRFSPPRTSNTISVQAVADAAYLLAREWDKNDLYDGAETFKAGFQSKFNAQNVERIDLSFPMSPIINVHQIGAVGNLVSPSS